MLGASPESANVVVAAELAPLDDALSSNVPVVIETIVPCGLLLLASITVMDVLLTTKPTTPGELANVYVEIVSLNALVVPPTLKAATRK